MKTRRPGKDSPLTGTSSLPVSAPQPPPSLSLHCGHGVTLGLCGGKAVSRGEGTETGTLEDPRGLLEQSQENNWNVLQH